MGTTLVYHLDDPNFRVRAAWEAAKLKYADPDDVRAFMTNPQPASVGSDFTSPEDLVRESAEGYNAVMAYLINRPHPAMKNDG